MTVVFSLLPILTALFLGVVLGNFLPKAIIRLMNPLVWVLLLLIGYQFGEVFLDDKNTVSYTLWYAFVFALINSFCCFAFIYCWRWRYHQQQRLLSKTSSRLSLLLASFKAFGFALGLVAFGVVLFAMTKNYHWAINRTVIDSLLYALIFVVGVDVRQINLRLALTRKVVILPLFVVIASMMAGLLCSLILEETIWLSLALSSGFGWFTLSGVLVANEVSPWYGTVALLNDLFRELIAILLLYTLSQRYAYENIAVSGATALDSTLPMIKQNNPNELVPMAMISGLLLTLLAPVLMSFFLAFL